MTKEQKPTTGGAGEIKHQNYEWVLTILRGVFPEADITEKDFDFARGTGACIDMQVHGKRIRAGLILCEDLIVHEGIWRLPFNINSLPLETREDTVQGAAEFIRGRLIKLAAVKSHEKRREISNES